MENTDDELKYLVLILTSLIIVVFLISLSKGEVSLPVRKVVETLIGKGDAESNGIILKIRLPRFLLSAAVGGMLAAAGLIMQTIFRNPLVDPYFLGVSSAAELGINVSIILGITGTVLGISIMSVIAFSFSVLLILGMVKIARAKSVVASKAGLVLIGIAISYILSAINNLLVTYKEDVFLKSTFWALKGFNTADMSEFLFVLPFLVIGFIYTISNAKRMNIYLSSDLTAYSLGINLNGFVPSMLAVSATVSAASVMVGGAISFIGLFTPHIGRLLVGEERKRLSIVTLLLGITLLPLFDFISRTIISSQEIPINVITALVGAPFFIYLFFKGKNAQY